MVSRSNPNFALAPPFACGATLARCRRHSRMGVLCPKRAGSQPTRSAALRFGAQDMVLDPHACYYRLGWSCNTFPGRSMTPGRTLWELSAKPHLGQNGEYVFMPTAPMPSADSRRHTLRSPFTSCDVMSLWKAHDSSILSEIRGMTTSSRSLFHGMVHLRTVGPVYGLSHRRLTAQGRGFLDHFHTGSPYPSISFAGAAGLCRVGEQTSFGVHTLGVAASTCRSKQSRLSKPVRCIFELVSPQNGGGRMSARKRT